MLPPFVAKGPTGWVGDQLKTGCALEAGAAGREPRQRGGPIHDLVQLRGRGGAPSVDRKPEHGGDTWMPSG